MNIFNQFSGKNAPGPRFRFFAPKLFHHKLYLPLQMKYLPVIKQLMEGEDPLNVFSVNALWKARHFFTDLRNDYDFSYWAASVCRIPDRRKPKRLVPLFLNIHQRRLVNIFLMRRFRGETANYIITKSIPKIGLTTVVLAFIAWRQVYSIQARNAILSAPHADVVNRHGMTLYHILENIHGSGAYTYPWREFEREQTNVAFLGGRSSYYRRALNVARDSFISLIPFAESKIDSFEQRFYLHVCDVSSIADKNGHTTYFGLNHAEDRIINDPESMIVIEGDSGSDNLYLRFLSRQAQTYKRFYRIHLR